MWVGVLAAAHELVRQSSQEEPPTGEPYVGRSASTVRREGGMKPIIPSYLYRNKRSYNPFSLIEAGDLT